VDHRAVRGDGIRTDDHEVGGANGVRPPSVGDRAGREADLSKVGRELTALAAGKAL